MRIGKMTQKTLLCFGDSNTWGAVPNKNARYSETERWPTRLATLLSENTASKSWQVVEAGLPGRTTVFDDPIEGDKSGIKHLPIWLDTYLPDVVLILLGTNDLKYRFNASPMDISLGVANLVKCVQEYRHPCKKSSPDVLLIAPPPIYEVGFYADMFQGGEEKSKQLDRYFSRRAKELKCRYFDAGSVIASCKKEGIHWPLESHKVLAHALCQLLE